MSDFYRHVCFRNSHQIQSKKKTEPRAAGVLSTYFGGVTSIEYSAVISLSGCLENQRINCVNTGRYEINGT